MSEEAIDLDVVAAKNSPAGYLAPKDASEFLAASAMNTAVNNLTVGLGNERASIAQWTENLPNAGKDKWSVLAIGSDGISAVAGKNRPAAKQMFTAWLKVFEEAASTNLSRAQKLAGIVISDIRQLLPEEASILATKAELSPRNASRSVRAEPPPSAGLT